MYSRYSINKGDAEIIVESDCIGIEELKHRYPNSRITTKTTGGSEMGQTASASVGKPKNEEGKMESAKKSAPAKGKAGKSTAPKSVAPEKTKAPKSVSPEKTEVAKGTTTEKKQRGYDEASKKAILEAYKKGQSYNSIAENFHSSRGSVYVLIKNAGILKNPTGPRGSKK